MIHDVDESIRTMIKRHALNGADAEITFDAPTKEWASRRNKPTVDVYLYNIHEDVDHRQVAYESVRDGNGRVTERRPPPRLFKLSYLVTAWTKRPEDEHRLLSAVLGCFLRHAVVPEEALAPAFAKQRFPVVIGIAAPPGEDRSISDVWSALGGELKPSLDLVITAPFETERVAAAGPPVLEVPRIDVVRPDGASEPAAKPARRKGRRGTEEMPEVIEETIRAGKEDQPGRVVQVRGFKRE